MIEVIVKNIDGTQVATISADSEGEYIIDTKDSSVEEQIKEVISRASKMGIPLRTNRYQIIDRGKKYERLARWLKPGDTDFLQALADDLIRHNLFAYTVEVSNN